MSRLLPAYRGATSRTPAARTSSSGVRPSFGAGIGKPARSKKTCHAPIIAQLSPRTDSAAERFPAAETSEGAAVGDTPEPEQPPEFYEPGAPAAELGEADAQPGIGDEPESDEPEHDAAERPYNADADDEPGYGEDPPTAVIDRDAIEDEASDKESTIVMPPRRTDDPGHR